MCLTQAQQYSQEVSNTVAALTLPFAVSQGVTLSAANLAECFVSFRTLNRNTINSLISHSYTATRAGRDTKHSNAPTVHSSTENEGIPCSVCENLPHPVISKPVHSTHDICCAIPRAIIEFT